MAGRRGLVINDEQMQLIDGVLNKLRRVTASQFVALISTSGQPITTSPPRRRRYVVTGCAGGRFLAATRQLAEVLKEREFSLLFHEGRESNLHVMQVTEQILLLITFGHDTQVGRVRLYTGRAVEVLKPVFEAAEDTTGGERIIDHDYSREAGTAIDSWFPGEGDGQL